MSAKSFQTHLAVGVAVVTVAILLLGARQQDYSKLREKLDLSTPEAAALEYVSARLCGDYQIAQACSTDRRIQRLSQPRSQQEDDPVWPGFERVQDRQQMQEALLRGATFDCRPGKEAAVNCCCWVTVRGQRVDLLVLTLVNQQGLWLVD